MRISVTRVISTTTLFCCWQVHVCMGAKYADSVLLPRPFPAQARAVMFTGAVMMKGTSYSWPTSHAYHSPHSGIELSAEKQT